MIIQEFEQKIKLSKTTTIIEEQILELLEVFTNLALLDYISYYKYNYEYNDFSYKYTLDSSGIKIDLPLEDKKYKILLKNEDIVYGYIEIYQKIKSSELTKKVLRKINIHLKKQKDLEKKLDGNDVLFNILLIHDEELELLGKNLCSGLKALFNAEIILDSSIKNHLEILKSKDSKHIIIYLVEDETQIKEYKDVLKHLNELIIVIGPNDHKSSIYCGKLGIENYISINEFKAEDIKSNS